MWSESFSGYTNPPTYAIIIVSDELNIVAHFRFNNTKGNAANIHNFLRTWELTPSGGSCHQRAIKPDLTEADKGDISVNKNKQQSSFLPWLCKAKIDRDGPGKTGIFITPKTQLWVRFPQRTANKRKGVVEITSTIFPLFSFAGLLYPEMLPSVSGKNKDSS